MSEISIERALELAIEQHQSGHFQRAQTMYIAVLESDPGNVDAIHLLGVLAHQGNRSDLAVDYIERAVQRRPDEPVFRFNLSECYIALSRLNEAAETLEVATRLAPDYYNAWFSLCHVYNLMGKFDEAIAAGNEAYELAENPAAVLIHLGSSYRGKGDIDKAISYFKEATEEDPLMAEALVNLALAVSLKGELDEAITLFHKAISLKPNFAEAYNNLGVAYLKKADFENAAKYLNIAIELKPDFAQAFNNLGVTLRDSGRPEEAISLYLKAIAIFPNFAEAHNNAASAYSDTSNFDECIKFALKAIEINKDFGEAYFNVGGAYRAQGKLDEAIEYFEKSSLASPDAGPPKTMLGYCLVDRGEVDEGLEQVMKGLQLHDDPRVYGDMLLGVNYSTKVTPEQKFIMHKEVGEKYDLRVKKAVIKSRSLDLSRKLKIGYISPDFRMHSVDFFAYPLISNHDKSRFEIFIYSNVIRPDSQTFAIRVLADSWREIVGFTDDKIVETIVEDEIDILIDLAGHTGRHNLAALATKPAPILINAIGYPSTTGYPCFDYRITDSFCDPAGNEAYNTEKLIRLDPSFWCYRSIPELDNITPLPALKNGFLTFVSTNTLAKIGDEVLETWIQILKQIPTAKLIIQSAGTGSKAVQERLRGKFSTAGIKLDRVDLRGFTSFEGFAQLLDEVDLVLDPWPFNGGTTSCHNLYKGVPMITLEGVLHAGRMGVSMLNNVGLPQFIAKNREEYVQIAVGYSDNFDELSKIRASLRQTMLASPLCDAPAYAKRFEAALRSVWSKYCLENS